MLPDIRAVIATIAAAVGLLIVAFGVVATFRVAQESRAGSLQTELAQRGHALAPEPRPIVLIETPGPTLLAKAPAVEPVPPAAADQAAASETAPTEREQASPTAAAAVPESAPIEQVAPRPDPNSEPGAPAIAAVEPTSGPPAAPAVIAAAPPLMEPQTEPAFPVSTAIGGPSPQEIARAKAQRKAAERARIRKAAAGKMRKARAARIARERKAAAKRAAEVQKQASSPSPPRGFDFNAAGSFNSAPFGNTFNRAATNPR
jgi:hypothetical protein